MARWMRFTKAGSSDSVMVNMDSAHMVVPAYLWEPSGEREVIEIDGEHLEGSFEVLSLMLEAEKVDPA